MSRTRRLTVAFVLLMAVAAASAGPALARSRAVVLHPRFSRVPGYSLVASHDDVFLIVAQDPQAGRGVLIDDTTGKRRTVSFPSDCTPGPMSNALVAFSCSSDPSTEELYDVATGTTSSFSVGPWNTAPGTPSCVQIDDCGFITAIGTHWIQVGYSGSDPEHDTPWFAYQNLQTGAQLNGDQTGKRTNVDLDSAGLTEKVCRPLSMPSVTYNYGTTFGSLTPDAGYEIASGDGGEFLERCGSRLRERLTENPPDAGGPANGCVNLACGLAMNAHAVVWLRSFNTLSGIFLPSRRRFTIVLPAKAAFTDGGEPEVALTARHIYISTGGHAGNFRAPAPTP